MKQITLETEIRSPGRVCAGKLALTWGLYGYAVAWLWQVAGSGAGAQAAVWAVALAAGVLMVGMGAL